MLTSLHDLRTAFDTAGLPLKLTQNFKEFNKNLVQGQLSFLFDIQRGRRKGKNEFSSQFVMYPGDGTDVRVLSVDPRRKQLVLQVDETAETADDQREVQFMERTFNHRKMQFEQRLRRQLVKAQVRRFLVGEDEQHLFFAQLPKNAASDTVEQAHVSLKPKELRNKREGSGAYKRQGEWFLERASDHDICKIEEALCTHQQGSSSIRRRLEMYRKQWRLTGNLPVAGKGRPHICDEVAIFNGVEYARGNLRHPDHRTRHLHTWHIVRRNTETMDSTIKGQTWVD